MTSILRYFIVGGAMLAVAMVGCGQKGALVLPPPAQTSTPAAAPAAAASAPAR